MAVGGRTYLVTGAARGLGFEFCKQLLEGKSGAIVIAGVRSLYTCQALQQLKLRFPGQLQIFVIDVSNDKTITATIDLLSKTLPQGLDYLICNAGVGGKRIPAACENTASILEVFNTNVFGVLEVINAALPLLRRGSQRTIVNISSAAGSMTMGGMMVKAGVEWGRLYMAYKMSKSALNMMTQTLAADMKKEGFTMVAIHPGWVLTDMGNGIADLMEGAIPPLTTEESVAAMVKTISKLSPECTGAYIDWDGNDMPY